MSHLERQFLNQMRRLEEMARQASAYLELHKKRTVKPIPPPPDFMLEALKDKK